MRNNLKRRLAADHHMKSSGTGTRPIPEKTLALGVSEHTEYKKYEAKEHDLPLV